MKVLPCVVCFVDGIAKDRYALLFFQCLVYKTLDISSRLVGFEDLGNDDAFDSTVLEIRLATSGMSRIEQTSITTHSNFRGDTKGERQWS